jgi:hypothetical protein
MEPNGDMEPGLEDRPDEELLYRSPGSLGDAPGRVLLRLAAELDMGVEKGSIVETA